eukprot:sb/3475166/
MSTPGISIQSPLSSFGGVSLTRSTAKMQNAQNVNLYYLQQTCPILIRSTLTLIRFAKIYALKHHICLGSLYNCRKGFYWKKFQTVTETIRIYYEPTDTSKQPIRTRYFNLGHVTGDLLSANQGLFYSIA